MEVSACVPPPLPPWQGSWVIRQHQPSSVSVKWGQLWSDGGWHVSSHRAWVFSAKTSHNAFKEDLILPALQFKWRLKNSRHMSKRKHNFRLWWAGKGGNDLCQLVNGWKDSYGGKWFVLKWQGDGRYQTGCKMSHIAVLQSKVERAWQTMSSKHFPISRSDMHIHSKL